MLNSRRFQERAHSVNGEAGGQTPFQIMGLGTRLRRRQCNPAGFTIAELLVYLVIAVVVVGSIYQLLIGQNRLYTKQREIMDVRGTVRSAAALLAWELRAASSANGDLYSIGPNSVALRSLQSSGVICGEHETLLRYAVWGSSGEFLTTADDSALFFAAGSLGGSDDDSWKVVRLVETFDPVSGGVPGCFWGDTALGKGKGKTSGKGKACQSKGKCGGVPADFVMEVTGDVDDVYIGAPFRAFRKAEYGLYQEDGRWWLGRKVGAAASFEKLTGPLRSAADSGLVFTYYDQAGNVTADSSQVAAVEVIIRAESFGKASQGGPAQQDTLTITVSLRS